MADYSYFNVRRQVYKSGATFVPVCPTCFRFVKADKTIQIYPEGHPVYGGLAPGPNATCSKCGRVEMLFEGFY